MIPDSSEKALGNKAEARVEIVENDPEAGRFHAICYGAGGGGGSGTALGGGASGRVSITGFKLHGLSTSEQQGQGSV